MYKSCLIVNANFRLSLDLAKWSIIQHFRCTGTRFVFKFVEIWSAAQFYQHTAFQKGYKENYHVICQKRKPTESCRFNTCFVHAVFRFYWVVYKCSVWPPRAAWKTSGRCENSSKMHLIMSRSTVLIGDVIPSFISSIFARRCGTDEGSKSNLDS